MKKLGLFLSVAPYSGGMFQYCQSILNAAAALPADKYSLVVCYTDPDWAPFLKNYSIPAEYVPFARHTPKLAKLSTLIRFPTILTRQIIGIFSTVAHTLKKKECDLWFFPAQDPWSYLFPVPSLGTVHDLMHRYERRFPEVSSRGRYWYREAHFKRLCRLCRGVVVDSETGKKQVTESYGISNDRVAVLPYVPAPHIYEAPCPPDFEARYKLPPRFFVYPAQFWPHKNHLRLIEALAKLKTDFPDIALVLIGAFNHAFEDVRKRVQELDLAQNVQFIGTVQDEYLPEFYRRARALVMPTFFGPTNIPPLEAFALGCPVAISDIYGMPEQTGAAALRFDPTSINNLADCMRSLWKDDSLCNHLIDEGRKRSEQWNREAFNKGFSDIIQRFL